MADGFPAKQYAPPAPRDWPGTLAALRLGMARDARGTASAISDMVRDLENELSGHKPEQLIAAARRAGRPLKPVAISCLNARTDFLRGHIADLRQLVPIRTRGESCRGANLQHEWIRERLSEAVAVLRCRLEPGSVPVAFMASMPGPVRRLFDHYQRGPVPAQQPSPSQVSDCWEVCTWLSAIDDPVAQMVLLLHAEGLSLRKIAGLARRSHRWCATAEVRALEQIAAQLTH